jgi:branched-chain amino acid transport system permease protein
VPALCAQGVSFMIPTLMFAQAGFLTVLCFGAWSRGDAGFVLQGASRVVAGFDLSRADPRSGAALGLFAVGLIGCLIVVRSSSGRVMMAMRENAERSRMLGCDPFRVKLAARALSGVHAGR